MMNTQTTTYYTQYDYRPYLGTSYYRLKQVDTDGNFKYSAIKSVTLDIPSHVVLFPNPVTDILSVSTQLEANAEIVNSLGQTVIKRDAFTAIDEHLYQLSVEHLEVGIYFFVNGKEKHKLVKSQ